MVVYASLVGSTITAATPWAELLGSLPPVTLWEVQRFFDAPEYHEQEELPGSHKFVLHCLSGQV